MSAPANMRRLPEEKAKDNWQTPPELFQAIERLLGVAFELDIAASPENALCARFLTGPCQETPRCGCGLCAPWNAVSFGNPPFSLNKEFIAKACSEPLWFPLRALLVPNATDGRWWQAAYASAQQKYHLLARIPFIDPDTGKRTSGNTTGSTLFAWGASLPDRERCWDWRRDVTAAAQISKGATPLPWVLV